MKNITIIMCAYNEEKNIEKAIENLSEQDDLNFKIILVEDGSKDQTKEKIEEAIKKYGNNLDIDFIEKEHTGLADSRNIAVKKVETKYFMFQNVRDYLDQDAIRILNKIILDCELKEEKKELDEIQKETVDLIKFNSKIVDKYEELVSRNKTIEFNETKGEEALKILGLNDKMAFFASSYLYRTKFYIENSFSFEKGRYYEDYGMIPIILSLATNVISREETLYNYVEREEEKEIDVLLKKRKKKLEDILFIYNISLLQIEKQENSKKISFETAKMLKEIYTKKLIDKLLKLYKVYIETKKENDKEKEKTRERAKSRAKTKRQEDKQKDRQKEREAILKFYKEYKEKIKEAKLYKYVAVNSFKDKILRKILKYNINLYLKLKSNEV